MRDYDCEGTVTGPVVRERYTCLQTRSVTGVGDHNLIVTMTDTHIKLAPLTRNGNWLDWSAKLRALLSLRKEPLDHLLDAEPDEGDEAAVQHDKNCKNFIVLHVDKSLSGLVTSQSSASAAFSALQAELQEAMTVRKSSLSSSIHNLVQGSKTVVDYVMTAQELMNEVQDTKATSSGEMLCSRLVAGLRPELRNAIGSELIAMIETATSTDDNMSDDDILSLFQRLVQCIRSRSKLLMLTEGTSSRDEQEGRMYNVRQNMHENLTCHHCRKKGHIRRNCPEWLQLKAQQDAVRRPWGRNHDGTDRLRNASANNPSKAQALLSQLQKELSDTTISGPTPNNIPYGGTARMYSMQAIVTEVISSTHKSMDKRTLWLDGGSTHHVVHDKHLLHNCSASAVNSVLVAGGEQHEVTCCGNMHVDTAQGVIILTGVLCVPSFVVNLCSGPQLDEKGLHALYSGGVVTIFDDCGEKVMDGRRDKGLYRLNASVIEPVHKCAHAYMTKTDISLLHRRLGHAAISTTKKLVDGNAVLGKLPITRKAGEKCDDSCEICLNSKMHRATFKPKSKHTKSRLEVLHSDVIGPFRVTSPGGARFAVTLIDDFTGYGQIYPIQYKSDVQSVLEEAIYRLQTQTGVKVKALRTDRGTEYLKMFPFLRREGIEHQISAAYTPEQNGRAERYNRSILEKMRAMLLQFSLPKMLWAESAKVAAYVHNFIPKAGKQVTPYEDMFEVKPSLEHLRVFGCMATVHIPAVKRDKLDATGETCMFVGYTEGGNNYRLLSWSTGKLKLIESANVVFSEDRSPALPRWAYGSQSLLETHVYDDDWEHGLIAVPDETKLQQGRPESTSQQNEAVAEATVQEDVSCQEEGLTDAVNTEDAAETLADIEAGSVNIDETEDDDDRDPAVRRSTRVTKEPDRLVYNVTASPSSYDEPRTIKEAFAREDGDKWREAVNEELAALATKGVYEVANLPPDRSALTAKMVLKVKRDQYGNVEKYKARLVARGFQQEEGIDFDEVFAPTAQSTSFRVLCAMAAFENAIMRQIDVSTAFLNGELDEEVYLQVPKGIGMDGVVWRLKKALYGLRQAARAWYDKLTEVMSMLGFTRTEADPCLFYRHTRVFLTENSGFDTPIFILVHVDDAIICGGYDNAVEQTLYDLMGCFEVKDLGEPAYFLGVEIHRTPDYISLTQEAYCHKVLKTYGMENCTGKATPMATGTVMTKEGTPLPDSNQYRAIVGSLLYLSVKTRPDIAYAVGVLSRYMSCPTEQHMTAAKHVLRYLKSNPGVGITYRREESNKYCPPERSGCDRQLRVFSDSDFAGDKDTRKSTSGMVAFLASAPIMWSSKLQSLVTTSTTEAEFVAAASALKEGLWIQKLLKEVYHVLYETAIFAPIKLLLDNQAAIQLIRHRSAGVSGRSKHIDVQHLFIRDRYARGDLWVEHVGTSKQLADVFTKALPGAQVESFRWELGMSTDSAVTIEDE